MSCGHLSPDPALWETGPSPEHCKGSPKVMAGLDQKMCILLSSACLATSSHLSVHPNWDVIEPELPAAGGLGASQHLAIRFVSNTCGDGAEGRWLLSQEQSWAPGKPLECWGVGHEVLLRPGARNGVSSRSCPGPWGSQVVDKYGVGLFSGGCDSEERAACRGDWL